MNKTNNDKSTGKFINTNKFCKFAWGVDQRKFQSKSRENSSSCGTLHRKKDREKADCEERKDM